MREGERTATLVTNHTLAASPSPSLSSSPHTNSPSPLSPPSHPPPVSECPPYLSYAPVVILHFLQHLDPHVRDRHGHTVVEPNTSL